MDSFKDIEDMTREELIVHIMYLNSKIGKLERTISEISWSSEQNRGYYNEWGEWRE